MSTIGKLCLPHLLKTDSAEDEAIHDDEEEYVNTTQNIYIYIIVSFFCDGLLVFFQEIIIVI